MADESTRDRVLTPPPRDEKADGARAFDYLAMDGSGRELRGSVTATDDVEAVAKLKMQGLFPIEVWEDQEKKAKSAGGRAGSGRRKNSASSEPAMVRFAQKIGLRPVIRTKILCNFTRQLATMLDAGLPLLLSLRTLYEQCGRSLRYRSLKTILQKVVARVEGGMSLSEALQEHPHSFSTLYVGLVRAGEASGAMEEVLNRLAEYIEKSEKMKKKVKAGMTYPVVVLTIAIAITVGLMIFIVPRFAEMFNELLEGVQLPKLTQIVIGISDMIMHNIKGMIGAMFLMAAGAKFTLKTQNGRLIFDWLVVKVPPINGLVVKTVVGRFCATLGTLLDAGVPILDALDIVAETSSNEIMRRAVLRIYGSVSEGERVAKPLEKAKLFPGMVVRMIDIGEQTGSLPDMLKRIARNYEEEVDNALEALISLIEPLMIVFLAVVIGGIVMALFLPLIKIIEQLGV